MKIFSLHPCLHIRVCSFFGSFFICKEFLLKCNLMHTCFLFGLWNGNQRIFNFSNNWWIGESRPPFEKAGGPIWNFVGLFVGFFREIFARYQARKMYQWINFNDNFRDKASHGLLNMVVKIVHGLAKSNQ